MVRNEMRRIEFHMKLKLIFNNNNVNHNSNNYGIWFG